MGTLLCSRIQFPRELKMSSILSTITPYLPQHEGILPKWMLFVSLVALGNSIQSYLTISYTARLYAGPKLPTPILSSKDKSTSKPPSNSPAKHLQPAILRVGFLDVCCCVGTLYERVVDLWHGEAGRRAGFPGHDCVEHFGVDVASMGILCSVDELQ